MINIEKLNLDVQCGGFGRTVPGLIDYFISDFQEDNFAFGFVGRNMSLFWPTLEKQLEANDIFLGKKYGTYGATIDQALADQISYFEINHYDFVINLDIVSAKLILESCNIIANDLLEGGEFTESNFINWLKENKITPRNLVLQTSGYHFKNIDIPNTTVLPCTHIYAFVTLTTSDYVYLLFDHTKKQHYIDTLIRQRSKTDYKYHAMIPNRKPRINRVRLLSNLCKENVLEKYLWSLAWKTKHNDNPLDFNDAEKVSRYQDELQKYKSENIMYFLRRYGKHLPKNLTGVENKDTTTSGQLNLEWPGSAKWMISNETNSRSQSDKHDQPLGFITEKTFKAFLLGMPVIVNGTKGVHNAIKEIGLPILDTIDDNLEAHDRTDAITDFLINDLDSPLDIKEHNDEVIEALNWFWTKENLCKLISKPLYQLLDL